MKFQKETQKRFGSMYSMLFLVLVGFLSISIAVGCGEAPVTSAESTEDLEKTSTNTKDEDDSGEEASDKQSSESSDDSNESKNIANGEDFFKLKLEPAFKQFCGDCHAAVVTGDNQQGPLSIFVYDSMKDKFSSQSTIDDTPFLLANEQQLFLKTELMSKMLGSRFHGGGKQCDSPKIEPCESIRQWWVWEFGEVGLDGVDTYGQHVEGAPDLSNADPRKAAITAATALGKIIGWAVNKTDLNDAVQVNLYIGGDKDSGTLAGTDIAEESGVTGGHPGRHQFSIQLADEYRDGVTRDVYIYGVIDGVEQQLSSSATSVTAYKFSDAGRKYYEDNVASALSGCAGCHEVNYEQQFYSLVSPSPADGGAAANNELFNKPSLSNGESHGGGRKCANGNSSPCDVIKAWWDIEFGNL